MIYVYVFFFFKHKTAYDMRISDWSSDVCSSDLLLSSAFATISLTRAGIRHFWSKGGRYVPYLRAAEAGAVLFLIVAAGLLTVYAEPAMRYATRSEEHT